MAAIALADSDRENAAWGAEWNLAVGDTQHVRVSFERTGFDLLAPVALAERRRVGLAEYRKRWKRSELIARYGFHDQKELVNGSRFDRDDFALTQRTRFDSGVTWLSNVYHTLSNAVFSSGVKDELTIDRFTTVVDVPRRRRAGWTFSYEYNRNDGRFVDSTSQNLRGDARFLIGDHWEVLSGAAFGAIDTTTSSGRLTEDIAGANAGVRFNRAWDRLELSWTATLGYNQTDFSEGPGRDLLNRATELDLRVPMRRGGQFFSTLSRREDETDVTGVGFSRDENYLSLGVEGPLAGTLRGRTMAYVRDVTRDTFDYGVQESRTYGLESTLTGRRLALTVNLATTDGISDFIPDPALGTPFTPGADLVNSSDSLIAGLRWRIARRLRLRAEGRYERRHFTSIGREEILSFHPEIDWVFRVWTFSLGYSRYERDNTTSFSDDTWLVRISRKFL
ncbi:MAG: hypothetical protein D6718_04225 [Acidobacteria bacterium]|nr:MAG: hypothetical protein D6718_04225 [Acidobacteriota bacterium]